MSLIMRTVGIVAASALGGVAVAAVVLPAEQTEIATRSRETPAGQVYAPLPAVNAEAPTQILDTSPFAKDRSGFDRATASAPPAPPVEVRLTGIFRVGKELRASLLINGQAVVVRKGDETAAGKVETIEPAAVVVSGATEQRLEMYK